MKHTPTVRFNLKTPSAVTSLILAKISFGYSESDYSDKDKEYILSKSKIKASQLNKYKQVITTTGITIPTAFFDRKNQTIIGSLAKEYNPKLDQFKKDVELIFESISKGNILISPAYFKNEIKKVMFHIPIASDKIRPIVRESAPSNITEYVTWKIEKWKASNPKAGKYRNQTRFLNWLERFEEYKTNQINSGIPFKLNFETLDDYTLDDFVAWQKLQKKTDKTNNKVTNYKINYLSKIKCEFKNMANYAKKDKVKVNPELDFKAIDSMAKITEKVNDIYLLEEHLDKIRQVKFNPDDDKRLPIVRDLILVHIACGLRVEDFLRNEHIYKEGNQYYFELDKTEKTDERVKIPVFEKEVINIYKKYGNCFPTKNLNSIDYNELIKTVCLKAGLTDKIEVRFKNPITMLKDKEVKSRFAMCSARTMRKTFASRMIRKFGMPLVVVMDWTGHTTEENFKEYVRLSKQEIYEIAVKQMENYKTSV